MASSDDNLDASNDITESQDISEEPASSRKSKKPRQPRYAWTETSEKFYLDLMVNGLLKRENGKWPSNFWDICCERMKEAGYRNITTNHLNSKRSQWSDKWRTWKSLFDNSGWGFDEETGMLTAADETWDAAIKADHTGYTKYFRRHPLKWRTEMEMVYSEMHATGEFVRGPDDDFTTDSPGEQSKSSLGKRNRKPAVAPEFKRVRRGDQIAESFQAVSKKYLAKKDAADAIELLDEEEGEMSDNEYLIAVEIVSKNASVYCALKPNRRSAWLRRQIENHIN